MERGRTWYPPRPHLPGMKQFFYRGPRYGVSFRKISDPNFGGTGTGGTIYNKISYLVNSPQQNFFPVNKDAAGAWLVNSPRKGAIDGPLIPFSY